MLLKPVPLHVPCEIELRPSQSIRVTLLEANHCPGAVMFLVDDDSKAILYTGDIRAEPWWVNSIVREPSLLPYTHGIRRLDKIYLDTTFAINEDPYRKFPTKAQGLSELLTEVSRYPNDTIFHMKAWTLGYEEEGDIPEIGAGGGGGDLTQTHELELLDSEAARMLLELCATQIQDTRLLDPLIDLIKKALDSGKRGIALDLQDPSLKEDTIPLENLIRLLSTLAAPKVDQQLRNKLFPPAVHDSEDRGTQLTSGCLHRTGISPKKIEMCHLLSVFKPRDVYPCVTDQETSTRDFSVEELFSHLCSGNSFCYDLEMRSNHDINDNPHSNNRAQQKPSSRLPTLTCMQGQSDTYFKVGETHGRSKEDRSMDIQIRDEDVEISSRKRSNRTINIDKRPWKKAQPSASKVSAQHTVQAEATALPESLSGWLQTSDPAIITTKPTVSKVANGVGAKTLPHTAAGTQYDPLELSDASRSDTTSEGETVFEDSNVSKATICIPKSETELHISCSALKTSHLDRAPDLSYTRRRRYRNGEEEATESDKWKIEHRLTSASPQNEDDEEL
ncbi:MAG: hypothetical protein Q9212_001647 [Teloschistes hypoglaucus]